MWAVGVIMYMLLAGKPPFEGRRDQDVFDEIIHREPNIYEGVWEHISKDARVSCGAEIRGRELQDKSPSGVLSCYLAAWESTWFSGRIYGLLLVW